MLLGREPTDPKKPTGAQRVLHVLKECPKSFITDESRELIQFYLDHMTFAQALPEQGGLFDQPALVIDAIRVIRDEIAKVQESHAADLRREQQKQSKKVATTPKIRRLR